jgi:hypothetical protein
MDREHLQGRKSVERPKNSRMVKGVVLFGSGSAGLGFVKK